MTASNHRIYQTSLTQIHLFLQLIFVLYSNHMCYTFIIMLLSLNNESLTKQMLCTSEANRRPFLLIFNQCRDTPSCKICSWVFCTIYLKSLFPPPHCKTGNNIIELFYSSVRILKENRRPANHNGSLIQISNCYIQPSWNGGYRSIPGLPMDIYPNIQVMPQYDKWQSHI